MTSSIGIFAWYSTPLEFSFLATSVTTWVWLFLYGFAMGVVGRLRFSRQD